MSGDHRFSSAIAPLAARLSNTLTQHQRRIAKQYTLPPPALYLKLQFNKSLYSSPWLRDSQGKEFQVFSPVLLLLRRPIAFREGLWRGVSDSVIGFKISLTLLGNYLL
ncbi:MAG: hypothetical protein EWV76_22255 [Microcystis novacekii Mn_MB_F_20050700_S1]|uniref:Uncharacterized protein n=1 Tax=Microcystis novacekii Mn_MB_F_20050700_S1D TaxID=2486266 RepID=A0A552IEJ0_9CHRO|nr:MAG: hypothetical protein EWV76_22255 [Microcystis novacekii Mn_MB_F_20050700_S1]TRU81873.1 MAG: hypothetical protein EWV54_23015 [Microcystis novacekii Mn_MB_F_20050700_S1D]